MKFAKRLVALMLSSILLCSCFQALRAFDLGGTHIPALLTAALNTEGPILEMGCGHNSTTVLHAICAIKQRYLLSVENNLTWMNQFTYLKRDWHQFQYVTSWDQVVSGDIHWSVVLIDHAPELRRKIDIQRLRKQTDIFVVHDTEAAVSQYEDVLRTFKYRYDYKQYNPYTTLVSDTINVAKFFE